jgi:tetratricopeptide (TPR) repeat protein
VLDHSWALLNAREQHILRQLSVFRGGMEREAGAQVMGASIAELAALVDKSLLRSQASAAGQRRDVLHELVRQYAATQLELAGETAPTRTSQLRYFLALAEQAAPNLTGSEQGRWVVRLEAEHSNLRAALEWALESRDVAAAARVCAALWRFWQIRGNFTEGRQWIARVLKLIDEAMAAGSAGGGVAGTIHAHVLKAAGVLAWVQSDYGAARAAFEASLALYRELDDTDGIAAVSSNLGVLAMYQGDYAQATVLFQTGLALRRELRDTWGTAVCLNNLGAMAGKQGDLTLAQTYYQEALALYRELGYERGIAILLGNLGDVALDREQFERAQAFSMESLDLQRKLGDTAGTASALVRLGALALRRGDVAVARSYYAEGLPLFQALGDKEYIAICWEGFAGVAAAERQWERATRLWGAADAVRRAINVPLEPSLRAPYERNLALVRANLDAQAFAAAWAEGQTMAVEQAATYALATDVPGAG